MKAYAAKPAIGPHHILVKFCVLVLLVLVQMGAVPFLAILLHNSANYGLRLPLADGRSNLSIVFKQDRLN